MGKRNPYRFSIKLDENDTDHQMVGSYLNTLGRKKAKIIVKAILMYLEREKEGNSIVGRTVLFEKSEAESCKEEISQEQSAGRMIQLDMDAYSMDEAEIALMRRNYEKLGKG